MKVKILICLIMCLLFLFVSVYAEYQKIPILMVHGLGGNSSSWYFVKARLKANGYPAKLLFTINMQDNYVLCAKSHVEQISDKIEEIVATTGYSQVDVIGHSRGGLNLYDYMLFGNGIYRVRNWVSIGGANNAYCFIYGHYIGDPTPGNVLYTSIYSLADRAVKPYLAIIKGARNIPIDKSRNVSHISLLFDPLVFAYILEGLQGMGLNGD